MLYECWQMYELGARHEDHFEEEQHLQNNHLKSEAGP